MFCWKSVWEAKATHSTETAMQISILVLLDIGLGVCCFEPGRVTSLVSILVLLDIGLGDWWLIFSSCQVKVSILVLLDIGLGA